MMPEPVLHPHLQVFALVVLLAFLGWVVRLIRSHRLTLGDSLLWLLSTFGALGVTLLPRSLVWIARLLGVAVPSNALFALALVYLLLNLLSVTIAVSNASARTRRLTQECALLRAEIDSLRALVVAQESKATQGALADR